MKKIFCLMVATALLGACNATKEDLGLDRKVPDASKVSEQKRLILPPNYDLRPVVPMNQPALSAETGREIDEEIKNLANE